MKRILIAIMALSLLLTGAVAQVYTHKVSATGNSQISEARDVSFFLSLLPTDALSRMDDACRMNASLDCSLDNTTLTMSQDISASNQYYTLVTDSGFPFVSTTLTINRIPSDLFDAQINAILLSAKLVSEEGSARPIDLTDKSSNAAKAAAMRSSGLEATYSVEMPNGEKFDYDLVAVLGDSAPIMIQTQELNSWTLVLILGIGLVAFVAYSFFGNKRSKKH